MIRKLLRRILRRPEDNARTPAASSGPVSIPRDQHGISREQILPAARKVCDALQAEGYQAYVVGGAVRDLIAGIEPKDFDVATSATPEQVTEVFRRARMIGRRFKIVHVMFGRDVIEVTTFRGDSEAVTDEHGRILHDNVFGTMEEDAARRDFTVNALFYNIADFSVIDYVGGVDDLEKGLIRVIGDPDLRFPEDPVRMLRACEFAGRLGFSIETGTQEAIQRHREDLRRAAAPRLTEELQQLLRCGSAGAAMQWMLDLELLDVLLPEAQAMIAAAERGAGDFGGILPTLDRMVAEGREIEDVVLLAAVLLPQVMLRRFEAEAETGRWMPVPAFRKIASHTLESFLDRFSLAKFKRDHLMLVLEGFHRLCSRNWTQGQRVRFASKSTFDDSLLLFEILVRATGEGRQALNLWEAARRQRPRKPQPHVETKRRRRRRPRRRRRRRN